MDERELNDVYLSCAGSPRGMFSQGRVRVQCAVTSMGAARKRRWRVWSLAPLFACMTVACSEPVQPRHGDTDTDAILMVTPDGSVAVLPPGEQSSEMGATDEPGESPEGEDVPAGQGEPESVVDAGPESPSEPAEGQEACAFEVDACGVCKGSSGTCAWRQASVGVSHTCGVDEGGRVWCWGNGRNGKLGLGNVDNQDRPSLVSGLGGQNIVQVSAGEQHSCALSDAGRVWCWGKNDAGQLGVGLESGPEDCAGESCSKSAVEIESVLGLAIVQLDSGRLHTCARGQNGDVHCWGDNEYGQLGINSVDSQSSPTKVALVNFTARDVATSNHTCVFGLGSNQATEVYCWGFNRFGQVGVGLAEGPASCGDSSDNCAIGPIKVQGISGLTTVDVTAGREHSCLATDAGELDCWGNNWSGQLGIGSTEPDACQDNSGAVVCALVPEGVAGVSDVVEVGAGALHTCVRTTGGNVYCFGNGDYGQTGQKDAYTGSPVLVGGLDNITEIAAGDGYHSCARTATGELLCWGWNGVGQLGVETDDSCNLGSCSAVPVKVEVPAS